MKRSMLPGLILMILGGGFLVYRASTHGMGKQYVAETTVTAYEIESGAQYRQWTVTEKINLKDEQERKTAPAAPGEANAPDAETQKPNEKNEAGSKKQFRIEKTNRTIRLSLAHTVGIWIAGLLTLAVLSFLYGDNPFYKLAEAIFVGVSAAYLMVVGFWTTITEKLLASLFPHLIREYILPGLEATQNFNPMYLAPLLLSVLMLMRLSPYGSWLARWPLAFFIGATAGFRLLGFFEADFVAQIRSTILPIVVFKGEGYFDFWASMRNLTIIVGVLTTLFYFFFSVEHRGVAGSVARLGVFFLMITFGANFGYTVMGRIALLAQRLEFLFDDWLWLIDPLGRR